jgi:hypothetical protein
VTGTTALTVNHVRIVLPGVLLLALGTIFSAILYALDKPGEVQRWRGGPEPRGGPSQS